MELNDKLYSKICDWRNLVTAWKKARKGKNRKRYVKRFEINLRENLLRLKEELENKTYEPKS